MLVTVSKCPLPVAVELHLRLRQSAFLELALDDEQLIFRLLAWLVEFQKDAMARLFVNSGIRVLRSLNSRRFLSRFHCSLQILLV